MWKQDFKSCNQNRPVNNRRWKNEDTYSNKQEIYEDDYFGQKIENVPKDSNI